MAAPRPTLVGFRVKYWTEWGQNLVVVGNHPKLGEWDVRKGVWMHCQVRARGHPSRSTADGMRSLLSANPNYLSLPRRTRGFPPLRLPAGRRPRARHLRCPRRSPTHRFPSPSPSLPVMAQHVSDDELLWTGHVTGVFPGSFEYRYAVVDSDMNVVRWDAFAHTASFGGSHARLRGKEDRSPDRVEIYDTWEFQSHPENLFRRSTFRDVVVPPGRATVSPGTNRPPIRITPTSQRARMPWSRAWRRSRSRLRAVACDFAWSAARFGSSAGTICTPREAARRSADGTANALSP